MWAFFSLYRRPTSYDFVQEMLNGSLMEAISSRRLGYFKFREFLLNDISCEAYVETILGLIFSF